MRSNIVILYVVVKRCSDSCILNKLSNLKIRYFWFLWWDGLRKVLLGNLLYFSPYEGKEKIFQQTGFEVLLTPWFTLCKKKKKSLTIVTNTTVRVGLFICVCMITNHNTAAIGEVVRGATSAWLPNCLFGNGNQRHLNQSNSTTMLSNPVPLVQSHHATRIVVWLAFTPTQ